MPTAIQTGFANGICDTLALPGIERWSFGSKCLAIVSLPFFINRNVRSSVDIVTAISRATLVTMEPRAMAAKSDQIGQREIGVVPHRDIGGIMHPPAMSWRSVPPAVAGG